MICRRETKSLMEHLRERFLKTYANVPLALRGEIILTLGEDDKPITWDVAYLEVKSQTEIAKKILEKLEGLQII